MNEEPEVGRIPRPSALMPGLAGENCAKQAQAGPDISRIEYESPENSVILSRKLEYLISRVGGCQTEEVRALVRRIMYEVISQRKY